MLPPFQGDHRLRYPRTGSHLRGILAVARVEKGVARGLALDHRLHRGNCLHRGKTMEVGTCSLPAQGTGP